VLRHSASVAASAIACRRGVGPAYRQFGAAERDGFADERVKDSLESEDGVSSVHEAYVHVVLTQAAYLSEMTAPQMDLLEALLRIWARKVRVFADPPVEAESGAASAKKAGG